MTEKLYFRDSHLAQFCSTVERIEQIDGENVVVLSATAFFPTGGGQPCDTGRIGMTEVYRTEEIDKTIYHFIKGEPSFSVGEKVTGEIDFSQRFARMQAHSGEHIVSGVAHTLFDAENVGFHMDGLLMTVDFDRPLTKEQIAQIENKANEIVWENRVIHAEIYSPEKLKGIEYRSKKTFDEDVRIVTIEGVDLCACCAPHVSRTGEIGVIKVLSCISHRGGVRITLICGQAAYRDYVDKYDQTLHIASMLAAKHCETDTAVEALVVQNKELKNAVFGQKKRLCAYIVSQSPVVAGNAVIFADGCDMDELCEISLGMLEKCGGVSVACSGSDANGYTYVITCQGVEMNRYARQINAALNGRGGGRDAMIRGSFKTTKYEITSYFQTFEVKEP